MSANLQVSPRTPLHIAVLAGGPSAESEISLQSGLAVANALRERGHRIQTIDPAETSLNEHCWDDVDVAFIALHGTFGEDGTVQRILERLEIPYTGSDSNASQLAFSKLDAKETFLKQNVPTPHFVRITESQNAERISKLARSLGYPLVAKPNAQGSSLGVSLVHAPEDLPRALTNCFHYDRQALLEQAIPGTEWTVGFLDELTLPLIQIETSREIFDFEAKYRDDQTRHHFNFELPATVVAAIHQAARKAYDAVNARGLARVDLRLDRYSRPYVLEVNTVPGLTDHSLVPLAASRAGLSLGELCEQAIVNSQLVVTQRAKAG